MKTNLKWISTMVIVVITLSSFQQEESKEANRLLPEKLRGIDLGILGSHFPNPTYAVFENGQYIWKHDTSVKSISEDLEIIEYGSYIYTDKGWYLRVTSTPAEFAKIYNCKNAILKKGKTYTDPASWRRSETLISGDAMWYYIAKNKSGKRFKGTALIETEAKLVAPQTTTAKKVILNTQKSTLKWTGFAEVGTYSLTGTLDFKSGEMQIADGKIISGKIIVDVTSIEHSDNNLKDHLKGSDFFDAAKYKEAVLIIVSSKKIGGDLQVLGNLTIKEKTKPISFKLKPTADGYTGKVTIDRTDFGVQYGSKSFFDNLGDRAISNNFDLEFSLKIQ